MSRLLQIQEQPASSNAPPDYEGCITVNSIMLDRTHLFGALEARGLKLNNTRTNQNLLLHHLGSSMTKTTIFLQDVAKSWHQIFINKNLL